MNLSVVMISNLSDELDLKLQSIISSGVHYPNGLRKCEHITPYRSALGWLNLLQRANTLPLYTLMYKLFKDNHPCYLLRRYIANQSHRPVRGHRKPLCIPFILPLEFIATSPVGLQLYPRFQERRLLRGAAHWN